MRDITFIKTISQLNELMGTDKPSHPLISIDYFDLNKPEKSCCNSIDKRYVLELYQIVLEEGAEGKLRYGGSTYDFQEGSLIFLKPGQMFYSDGSYKSYHNKGWSLSFHPDLIRKTDLGDKIDDYSFFSYDANEALYLSDKEKKFILNIVQTIEQEYCHIIDKHSNELIITNLKLLLDYSKRYYDRQLYTRTNLNKDIVSRFEKLLKDYYKQNKQLELGIPSVKYCGEELQMSPNYLSDLLRKETGRNALDHIHHYVIEKAKTNLLNTADGISQVAFDLGFEHAPYFSKLFKKKTGMSPKDYIQKAEN
ncbi:AraC family transcriptional regulator [Marinifilum breve]|uniref:AraC family transcriptional regulator n=1 Tax=Marinifilum breve TaxID=2184082 RepID=A0A2V3ZS61_9BACT|nr:helix-turn-helix domain-containing protein [Marinifilum breve]PXX95699.1 AraC family transcriptional regulator [Marinifilum breve]